MTQDERKKLYAALSAPFPEEAIERTDGRVTGRGYSTTGIKYQYVVDRLNRELGPGSFRAHRTVTVKEVTTAKGRTAYEAICDLTLELGEWVNGVFVVWAEALADGGHQSFSEADARKGSYTNAFKKAAAFFGVGREAYAGTIDDDNAPVDAGGQAPARAPAPRVDVAEPTGDQRPAMSQMQAVAPTHIAGQQMQQGRSRLSSKQLAAIWVISRKLGIAQTALRNQVRSQFGANLEFLSREQASQLIDALNRKSANGAHPPVALEGA